MHDDEQWARSAVSRNFDGALNDIGGHESSISYVRRLLDEIPLNEPTCRRAEGCFRSQLRLMNSLCDDTKAGCRESLWQPTRLTSPYRVLSTVGVRDDFYSSCLSWGKENVALALQDKVLLFGSSSPIDKMAVLKVSTHHRSSFSTVTSVAVCRSTDSSCVVGRLNGSVGLYESRGDGSLTLCSSFAMPRPPLEDTPLSSMDAMTATASVRCMSTTDAHPWLSAVGTAALGVFILDSRCRSYVAHMGGGGLSVLSGGHSNASLSPRDAVSLLSSPNGVCGVTWNASGSLIATGCSGGAVNIWSLSNTEAPVQHMQLPGAHTSVKAITFHPTDPYELLLGGGTDDGCLRICDVSSSEPHHKWFAPTGCQVTQALYSPDGAFVVSSQGSQVKGRGSSTNTPLPLAQGSSAILSGSDLRWGTDEQLKCLTEQFARVMRPGESNNEDGANRAFAYGMPSVTTVSHSPSSTGISPLFSLVVWRKGTQYRGSTPVTFAKSLCATGRLQFSSKAQNIPLPLVSMYVMLGHSARPIQLAAPFPYTVNQGCVASVAGGSDNTIRFWKCFGSRNAAGSWEIRTRANLRASLTDQDEGNSRELPLR
ncbi:WD domain [Trypanosoma vivax]|uniref:Uncharacterized protein n=1 Tax=Trypanosoma vivax (strain Y486) TaxID=1055687 RepID=G0U6U5_TRYVY|nr:hypothetical protein TRVL_02158 [Trypanosoma vivax]KAH8611268.1 WD domain [Trypanosoma vivax]CCC51600.1 conserved hypothetical protein [Trypanosoma vivax Y486]